MQHRHQVFGEAPEPLPTDPVDRPVIQNRDSHRQNAPLLFITLGNVIKRIRRLSVAVF